MTMIKKGNFTPWSNPKNQADIVDMEVGVGPFRAGEAEFESPGLRTLFLDHATDVQQISNIVFTQLRRVPIPVEFEFRLGVYADSDVKISKNTIPRFSKRTKREIATAIAEEICRNVQVVSVMVDNADHITIKYLKDGTRIDEDRLELLDPKFKINYNMIT